MMTRKLLVIILPFLILIFVSTANAETATTTDSAQTTPNTATLKLEQQMRISEDKKRTAVSKINEEARAVVQAKREEFKTRIQTIKNEKKKLLVERVDAKLAEINKNHTAKFMEVLTRLQTFLDKISSLTTNTTILANITTAQTGIDSAKTAVEAQGAKTYTMTVVDDSTLKANAGTTVSQLREDLMATYKLVIDAKQAVQKLNTDKSTIKKEATRSANI